MDGAPIDFIVIPVVAIISLVAWLVPIYWADSHPRKSPRSATVTATAEPHAVAGEAGSASGAAGQVTVPRQATVPIETVPAETVPAQDRDVTRAR